MMEYGGYSYPAVQLEDSDEWVPDGYLHNAETLPHLMPGDLREYFPKIEAAMDIEDGRTEGADWLEKRAMAEGLIDSPAGVFV